MIQNIEKQLIHERNLRIKRKVFIQLQTHKNHSLYAFEELKVSDL